MAREVLQSRRHRCGGPPQGPRLRARPAELRLRGAPPDVPAIRSVAALLAPARRLQQLRLRTCRAADGEVGWHRGPARQSEGVAGMSESIIVGGHRRIRPFNTADT